MNKMMILVLSALIFLPVLPAAGQQGGGTVKVVPEETEEILANPGMGWETFHHTSKKRKTYPDADKANQ